MRQGNKMRHKHGSNAMAHRVQTVTQLWSSFTSPAAEAKTIYQFSVHYSSSTIGSSVVSGTKELCIVVVSNTWKLFHPIQDGGGDGASQHTKHFCLLMFLFTSVPEVLVCCISSGYGLDTEEKTFTCKEVFRYSPDFPLELKGLWAPKYILSWFESRLKDGYSCEKHALELQRFSQKG